MAASAKQLPINHLTRATTAGGRLTNYESVSGPRKPYVGWPMLRIRTIAKIACVCLAVGSFVLMLSSRTSISAQAESWTPPHPMRLTPERALAIVMAKDRKLDYVPGEVLVRFREGVGAAGHSAQ